MRRGLHTLGIALLLAAAGRAMAAGTPASVGPTRLLADAAQAARWAASASDQVSARLAPDPVTGGLCLHYDFHGVSGYAVARHAWPADAPLQLPAHYRLGLTVHGDGPPNALQLKLVDASGDNVWWHPRPGFAPPARPTKLVTRQRQITFAWGPATDTTLRQAAALELVVASGQGGAGRLCFAGLTLTPLPAPGPAATPITRSSAAGTTLDLGQPTEFNGVSWQASAGPAPQPPATLQLSDDGRRWRSVHRGPASRRPLHTVWLPETEARYLRLRGGGAVQQLRVHSPADWPDRNALLAAQAAAAPRSHFPRALHGQQNHWTLVGVDGGGAVSALVDEDGALEPHRGGPSLAPLLLDARGQALGWAEVQTTHSLPDGHLPLPRLQWQHPQVQLTLDTAADGQADTSRPGAPARAQLLARYTVHNPTAERQNWTLALLLRPWQVNPPQQFLNTPGGVAPVKRLAWAGRTLSVDGQPWLHAVSLPAQVRAAAFDAGDVLGPAALPLRSLADPQGLASAALHFPLDLGPGESRRVVVALPLAGQPEAPADAGAADARFDAVAQAWRNRLGRVRFSLPPQARQVEDSLRAAHAHILMSRDGPALQPGTRSYARSWVRDGAMMVMGLLRLGDVAAAREFTTWYAGQLFANGKVPCCVDARGADPVAENDSHGQFIVAVAQLWRHTGDQALLQALWPKVDAAARYMARLSDSERTQDNQHGERAAFFGMMPASISHEGYSAKPMHSYWDNFWALAGWRDAQALADALGLAGRAAELAAEHGRFRAELGRSLATTMARHQIGWLPGAAELGDFDATSSTMIFSPAGAEDLVSPATLQATWQRWWDEAHTRPQRRDWEAYTPYELRSISALVRLGRAEQAQQMLAQFFADQRPAGWAQWAEVVDRRPRQPRFIGDMPHAWVSSDYLRSALDLLAFERDSDQALVLAAGVPADWLASGPVGVHGLRTAHGLLDYTLQRGADGRLRLHLQAGLRPPPGGLWLAQGGALQRLPDPAPDGAIDWQEPAR